MKKILEKLCSVRVILTVLCLLSFAMEARADLISGYPWQPYVPSKFVSAQLSIGMLQMVLFFSVLLMCFIALGFCLQRRNTEKSQSRRVQILFFCIPLFLIYMICKTNMLDIKGYLCLIFLIVSLMCASLLSGIWTTRKKSDTSSDSEKDRLFTVKRIVPCGCLLLISLSIVLYFEFFYLPYLNAAEQARKLEWKRQEQINKQEWEQQEREKEKEWYKEHPYRGPARRHGDDGEVGPARRHGDDRCGPQW